MCFHSKKLNTTGLLDLTHNFLALCVNAIRYLEKHTICLEKYLKTRYVYYQLRCTVVQRFKSNPIQGYFIKINRPVGFYFWTCRTGWMVWLEKSLRPSILYVFQNDSCIANNFRQGYRLKCGCVRRRRLPVDRNSEGVWFLGPVINRNDEDRNRLCAEPCALVSSAATTTTDTASIPAGDFCQSRSP